MILAKNQILLKLKYIKSKQNVLLDLLSRWYISGEARRKFKSITNNRLERKSIPQEFYNINDF